MKNIIFILLISTACSAQSLDVLSLHQDKQLHVSYTYIISSATTSYVLKKTGNKKKAILIGIGTAMSVGIAKEIYDARNGHAERGDLVADLIGSTLGSIVVTIPF